VSIAAAALRDRRVEIGAQLLGPRAELQLAEQLAHRARVAAHELEVHGVLGHVPEEREVAAVHELLGRAPGRASRAHALAARPRRTRRGSPGTPTPCPGSSCRTCPPPGSVRRMTSRTDAAP
jgi:hypothetical protein